MLKKVKNLSALSPLSPLSLVVLAACGGGGGGGAAGSSAVTVSGAVVKGPLENALVFLDYDNDGVKDAGEPEVRTDADGNYSISTTNTNYSIVAMTDGSTVDASSGAVLSGVTLKAPKGAGVVTPTTTLMEETGISAAQVATALGLPDGVDPLTFNPYADGVDADKALAVEKAAQQVMNAIKSVSAAAEGSGASADDAFAVALTSVAEVLQDKVDSNAVLDLTNTTDLDAIGTKASTNVTSILTGAQRTAFDNALIDTKTALKNVNDTIASVTDLTSDASKNAFSTAGVLANQVKVAASGGAAITFTDANAVAASAANAAPSNIVLAKDAVEVGTITIAENAKDLNLGSLSATDDGDVSALTFEIVKTEDYYAFEIDKAGVLSFVVQPDFETKPTYKVAVKVTDDGGKATAKTFEINVTDDGITPKVDVSVSYAQDAEKNFKLEMAEAELQDFSPVEVAFDKKVRDFEAWDGLAGDTLSRILDYWDLQDPLAENAISVSSSGITLTHIDGHTLNLEYANFSPSSLSNLQTMLDAASTWDDLQLSGGFKAISLKDPAGQAIWKLEHSAQGMKVVRPETETPTDIKSFTLDGDFSNQLSDFVNVLESLDGLFEPNPDPSAKEAIDIVKTKYDFEGFSLQDADGDIFAFRENDARTGLEIIYEDHKIDILTDAFSESTGGLSMLDLIASISDNLTLDAALSTYALQTKDPDLHLKYSYNGETLITIDTDGLSFNDINGTTGIFDNFEVWSINGNLSVGDDADGNVVLYEPTDTVAITVTDITLAEYNNLQPVLQL